MRCDGNVVGVSGHGIQPSFRSNITHHYQLREEDLADHLIVVPEYKIIFCSIAKVSSVAFNDLFRSLRAPFDPSMLEGTRFGRIIPFGRNSYASHNWSLQNLTQAVNDRDWVKAVFYREPLTRFVSAYKEKCERRPPGNRQLLGWSPLALPPRPPGSSFCSRIFGQRHPTFTEVVERLQQQPRIENAHWRPQHEFCGLRNIIQEFNFVELLDRRTSREKVVELLSAARVPDLKFMNDTAFNAHFPAAAAGDPSVAAEPKWHTTNADATVDSYYTRYLACIVFQYYYDDYVLFEMDVPVWARQWGFYVDGWEMKDCSTLRDVDVQP
ncbi:Sulfotransferase family-domain-containing protein [Tribonema minus]|uniref:Sulfotransferase family-domain-containing protein n=1 Tax=Tribonema minus TaxID=303371 RepID=A0A836CJ81_9STRA|nr:Sulfotransferase family-domain-containing protein [Tribonema minus]